MGNHPLSVLLVWTPSLTSKHAQWWSKIHGSGVGRLEIIHRAGKENCHADALSQITCT